MELQPADTTVRVGDDVPLRLTVLDASGRPLSARQVVWRSSDTTSVAVSSTGTIGGEGWGAAMVTVDVGGVSASARVAVEPRVIELPTPPGATNFIVAEVNNAGVAARTADDRQGFVYTAARGYELLPDPERSVARVVGINDRGEVAGYRSLERPIMWTAERQFVDLRQRVARLPATTVGINAQGAIVFRGEWHGFTPAAPASVYWGDGRAEIIPEDPSPTRPVDGRDDGRTNFVPSAIGDDGLVVGWLGSFAPHAVAATWRSGAPPARPIPGAPMRSSAQAVAAGSQVAGWFERRVSPDSLHQRAFYWSPGTGFVELPPAPNGAALMAWGVDDLGEVVGGVYPVLRGIPTGAFVWSRHAGLRLLPEPPGGRPAAAGLAATKISERGVVVGFLISPQQFGPTLTPARARGVLWHIRRQRP